MSAPPDSPPPPRWPAPLALFVVLACLATLVAVPFAVHARTAPLRRMVEEAAEPARTELTRVQFALAREMSAIRGFLATGDSAFLRTYREAERLERDAYAALEPQARLLGPAVLARFVELRTLSREWHARADDEELVAVVPEQVARARVLLASEQELYQRALRASSDLDLAIVDAARGLRARVRRAEDVGRALNLVLVLLAAAAALAVASLARRIRMLADQAAGGQVRAEAALEEVRRATDSRTRILRGITHDVKNPLGAADGYAELLQMGLEGDLAPGQARMVEGIRRGIGDALETVADLLAFSRAESGELPLETVPVHLAHVAGAVADEYRGAARAANLRLDVADADLPPVPTDAARVQQVLGNLLSNAIKYTPGPGRVTLSISAGGNGDGAPGPGAWQAVRVADTGPGIPDADRERIFAEFERLHDDSVRGHGLGLAIARRMARMLGGELTAGGEPGAGAVFTLWLPADGRPGAGG